MGKFRTVILFGLLLISGITSATVYYSKEEAFELAFGKGAEIEPLPVFLTDEQVAHIEKTAGVKLDSNLFNFHVGKKGNEVLGYAVIESHNVRTQPETVLIVLSPKGELVKVEMLAFHEPPEYQPPARWFERLLHRPYNELRLNQGADGIAGATLSSRASLDGIRKAMVVYEVGVKAGNN